MTIIIFIAVLLVTVIVHEWGHFYAARKSGMRVEEFGFGIPPRLFSWKKGDTIYSVNALPIGGFVRIAGENGLEGQTPPEKQFDTKPWYLKSIVLVAGVIMNLLLAFVLFTAAYSIGMPASTPEGTPTIVSVTPGSIADEFGVAIGDTITEVIVNGRVIDAVNTQNLHDAITRGEGTVSMTIVSSKGQEKILTHEFLQNEATEDRRIGIAVEPIATIRLPLFAAMHGAALQVAHLCVGIWQTLGTLLGGLFGMNDGGVDGLMGPVGLAREVGGAASIGFTYLLAFTAAISVNLAVLNILPFPALDGGRLLVVLLEAVTRKRFSPTVVGIIHTVGFLLLLALMLVLTVGDVRRLL